MIVAYSTDAKGNTIRRIVAGRDCHRAPRGERRPDRHFSQTLLRSYYQLECERGSRFRSQFTKNQIKKVHDERLQLFDQTGRDR
jgi:hypothetical protein